MQGVCYINFNIKVYERYHRTSPTTSYQAVHSTGFLLSRALVNL
jgi:hypothetical protein